MKNTMQIFLVGLIIFFFAVSSANAAVPTVVSAKITSPSEVSIEFSEAVETHKEDYTGFTGALSGRSITVLSGSGTRYVTLTFDGAGFSPIAAGGFTLGAGTVNETDGSAFSSAYVNVVDGQAPTITSLIFSTNSNGVGSGIVKIGDTMTLTFITSEAISTPVVNISGHGVSVSGTGIGPYVASYTYVTGDTAGLVPFTVSMTDIAGSVGAQVRTTMNFNSTVPEITSLTSNATNPGILKIGDSIKFRLTPKNPDPNLRVSGSYNGVSLNWSTIDRGYSYNAVYTVAPGHMSQSAPIQITGVVISDAAGNISPAVSGDDVQKVIFATGPAISEITPVPLVVSSASPLYEFTSTQAGSIGYGGDCRSNATVALVGRNTINFNALANGIHENCSITVIDSNGVASNKLNITPFTVAVESSVASPESTPAPAANKFVFTRLLKMGMTSDDVKELQKRLTELGVYSGPITGKFGALTFAAVKKFQQVNGILQVGYVGPSTRAALNK